MLLQYATASSPSFTVSTTSNSSYVFKIIFMPSLIKELSSAINILIFMFVSMALPLLTFTSFLPVTFPTCSLYTSLYHFSHLFHLALLQKIYYSFYNMCRVTYHSLRLYNRMRQKEGETH